VERGKQAFVALGCNSCHYVEDGVQRMKTWASPQIYLRSTWRPSHQGKDL
jgi:hypothetical protein